MSSSVGPGFPILFVVALLVMGPLLFAFGITASKRTQSKLSEASGLPGGTLSGIQKWFAEPSERYLASLGNGYIVNFFANQSLNRGFAVLSDRRAYFKGKCYQRVNGKIKTSFEERTVDLKDITGTGYSRSNPLYLLVIGISGLVLFFIATFAAIAASEATQDAAPFSNIALVAAFVFLIVYDVTLPMYILKRQNVFEIAFAGGSIAFGINLYNKSEIDEFQNQLRRAKDAVGSSTLAVSQPQETRNPQPPENNQRFGAADELKKYAELLRQEMITQEEYDEVKRKLLSGEAG